MVTVTELNRGFDFNGSDVTNVGALDAGSVSTDEINSTAWVHVAEGSNSVQSAFDEGYNTVYVFGDSANWSESVNLPTDSTLEFFDGVSITVPDAENLTEYTHNGDTVKALLKTDQDAEDVTVRGGNIDMENNGGKDTTVNWIGYWMHQCSDSKAVDLTVENVVGDADDNVARTQGILMSEAEDCKAADCYVSGTNYEGIGIRGGCVDCTIDNCKSENNGSYSFGTFTWRPTSGGMPEGTRIINCEAPGGIDVHGTPVDNSPQERVTITDTDADFIQLLDDIQDITIHNCSIGTRIWIRNPNNGTTTRDISIEECKSRGSFVFIDVDTDNTDYTVKNLSVHGNHANVRDFINIEATHAGLEIRDSKISDNFHPGRDFDETGRFIRSTQSTEPFTMDGVTVDGNVMRGVDQVLNGSDVSAILTSNDVGGDPTWTVNGAEILGDQIVAQTTVSSTSLNEVLTTGGYNKVVFSFEIESNEELGDPTLELRIDDDDTELYKSVTADGAGRTATSGNTEWTIATLSDGFEYASGEYRILKGNRGAIHGDAGVRSNYDTSVLVRGGFDNSTAEFDSLNVLTDNDVTEATLTVRGDAVQS